MGSSPTLPAPILRGSYQPRAAKSKPGSNHASYKGLSYPSEPSQPPPEVGMTGFHSPENNRNGQTWKELMQVSWNSLPSSILGSYLPQETQCIQRCMSPKRLLENHSLESGWVSGWGFEHMNKSREDIFEQVRLFLPGYHIRNQIMLPSEI